MRNRQTEESFDDPPPGFSFEISDIDFDIAILLKMLFNNNLTNIVAQLAELSTTKMKTLAGIQTTIFTYENLSFEDKANVDKVCKNLITCDIDDLKELDKLVGVFRNSGYSTHSRVKVYA